MNELLTKINLILKAFNDSFELATNVEETDGEEVVTGFSIGKLKNDASEFVDELFDLLSNVVENSSDYELAFDSEKGIVIVEKNSEVKFYKDEEKRD